MLADTCPETADVFPWTGNHPEDVLSETLVKIGLSNKPQIMNETNTARPSLWSNLKNKSGLQQLSSLFVQVLEKRQACGRLTAPNTFKPPPRLTLRDSTRETWLNDLANPAVGLRRLSRTIPHGIAGTVLLEHCLNKSIPLPRAVWLAKCVGINEMRSHKRKGQAATVTWVRGWTCSVEQFLEGAIASMGQPGWKPRITYAYVALGAFRLVY
jgi:mediator of RNA polymerase II transcription subunit 12